MKRLVPFAHFLFAGCVSPAGYCETVSTETCAQVFRCITDEPARSQLLAMYKDEATCRKTLSERSSCATQTERTFCRGLTWDTQRAAVCLDELKSVSCEELSTWRPACAPPCK